MKKILSLLLFLTFLNPASSQETPPLLDPVTRNLLSEVLSGELAKEYTIQISRYHRIQGSREYRESANYVLEMLRSFGFSEKEAYIESFPSDGKIRYQTWQSPSGWDMEAAELRMLEPYEERIVGFPEIPMSLITYSNPGDVTAELVWAGAGTSDSDYMGKDVKGKFVLATGYGGSVHRLAVLKYGARAVVCYLDDDRAKEYPDMLAYTGMWPMPDELERITFGFNLTCRQGEKLRGLLDAGEKVVLRGWARGVGLEPYYMDVVVAHIRGMEKPDEEFLFAAHLDHPKESANDNASGSAALLDICRSLREMMQQGRLATPKRSLRFIWVPEFHGTMAYVDAHAEITGPVQGGKFLAGVNMDMVGEHLELIHTNMIITRTPWSIPSVLNDVIANMAEMVDRMNIRTPRGSLSRFNYRVTPYSGGSDHAVFNDLKIPTAMIVHGDYTHHTSEDTPDKVDPVEIERAEIIALGAVLYLANLNDAEAEDLGYLTGANAVQRLGLAGRKAHAMVTEAGVQNLPEAWFEAQNIIDHSVIWEKEASLSILTYNNSRKAGYAVNQIHSRLEAQYSLLTENIRSAVTARQPKADITVHPESPGDNRIPVRLTRGPLDSGILEEKLTQEELSWYRDNRRVLPGNMQYEILNFMDGKRTVTGIRNAVSAAYNPVKTDVVVHYIEDLVKAGVVKWVQ